jgi:hypothetical protein
MKVLSRENNVLQVRHRHMGLVSCFVFGAAITGLFLFLTPKKSDVRCTRAADGGSCVIENSFICSAETREIPIRDIRKIRVATGQGSDTNSNTCQLLFITATGVERLSKVNTSNCTDYFEMEHKLNQFLSEPAMEEIHLVLDNSMFLVILLLLSLLMFVLLFVLGGARITVFDKTAKKITVYRKRFFRPQSERSSLSLDDFMSGAGDGVPGRVDPGAAALDQIEGTGLLSGAMGWYPRRSKQRQRVQAQVKDFLGNAMPQLTPPPAPER